MQDGGFRYKIRPMSRHFMANTNFQNVIENQCLHKPDLVTSFPGRLAGPIQDTGTNGTPPYGCVRKSEGLKKHLKNKKTRFLFRGSFLSVFSEGFFTPVLISSVEQGFHTKCYWSLFMQFSYFVHRFFHTRLSTTTGRAQMSMFLFSCFRRVFSERFFQRVFHTLSYFRFRVKGFSDTAIWSVLVYATKGLFPKMSGFSLCQCL